MSFNRVKSRKSTIFALQIEINDLGKIYKILKLINQKLLLPNSSFGRTESIHDNFTAQII